MKLIPCPICGERAEIEFAYGGQAGLVRPPPTATEAAWGAYLYSRENPKGALRERWRHIHGCGRFFNLTRDTVTDKFIP